MVYGYIRVSTDRQSVDNQRFEIERFCTKNSLTIDHMSILHHFMINGVKIWTIKDNYRLGDNIQAKILAFAFGLSAEIERDLISQRTKEALARKRSEGFTLGRPAGRKSDRVKLTGHEAEIQSLIDKNISKSAIARKFDVCRKTVISFLKNIKNQA